MKREKANLVSVKCNIYPLSPSVNFSHRERGNFDLKYI